MDKLPVVTAENYFDPDIQIAYMGSTQFKAFEKCEAAALAQLRGDYTPQLSPALLVGGYIDAYFEGSLPDYEAKHGEMFKRGGGLKSEYLHAKRVIQRMEADRLYSLLMSGQKQVIRTGWIAGVPFKIKIDSLLDGAICEQIASEFPLAGKALGLCDGAIVDQKAMRSLADVWSAEEGRWLSFVEAWGYDLQGAIYQAVEGNMLPFILAVGTKEAAPDLAALYVDDSALAAKLAEVEACAPRYQAIKEGKVAPHPCGRCPYCRATKKLDRIVHYRELNSYAE